MPRISAYRLASLALLVGVVLLGFLSLFFVWFLAPLPVVVLAYFAFVLNEKRVTLGTERRRRRELLAVEAHARRSDIQKL